MLRAPFCFFAVLVLLVPSALYSQISLSQLRNKAKQKMQQVENPSTANPSASAAPAANSGTDATATSATPVATAQPAAQNSTNAAAKTGPTRYLYCEVSPYTNSNPLRVYFSPAFATNAPKDLPVRLAFVKYVSAKYSESGSGSCAAFITMDQAEAELKRNEDLMGNAQNKRKIIPTEWKYDADAANEPVGAPAQSASSNPSAALPGRSLYHVCKAGGANRIEGVGMQRHKVPMPLYMSDIYPVPTDKDINHADGKAFAQFLSTKYDPYFKNQSRLCGENWRSMEEAQAGKKKLEEEYQNNARLNSSDYPNSNVIETEWKWEGHE
jgi:hypothetical protein